MVRTYAFRQYVEVLLGSVNLPEGMHHFTAEAVQRLLADFFDRGCCVEQLVGFLPKLTKTVSKLRRDNRYVQESGLLLDLYTSSYTYNNKVFRFTQPIEIGGFPALSQCFAGDGMKLILSVRECDEYVFISTLHPPPRKPFLSLPPFLSLAFRRSDRSLTHLF